MTPRPTASPPLIKVTFLLCLILATSLLTSWRLLLAVTAVGLFLVRRAGIPPGTLARRLLWLAYLSAGLLLTLTLLVPGSPLLKAYDRSERIYRAMLSRGYSIRQAPAAAGGCPAGSGGRWPGPWRRPRLWSCWTAGSGEGAEPWSRFCGSRTCTSAIPTEPWPWMASASPSHGAGASR